jgi:Sec-independent protein translocase protein TatA
MLLLNDLPLLALAPQQIALALAIALILFAPRLIPPIARLLGWLIGRGIRVRAGAARRKDQNQRRARTITVEEVSREEQTPGFPIADEAAHIGQRRSAQRRSVTASPLRTILPVMVVVSGAVAVILWFLLHAR